MNQAMREALMGTALKLLHKSILNDSYFQNIESSNP